ncbi:hypothetical protein POM88_021978 [Heracleum sosnowskyi]|uniref:Aminotransferase-like plant mobile domain-containing protein n=1 Tax=Heracleum sosnowskyi TaxID=360622 RepID=A0AAD8MUC1_9APIA|nr:hypothetical protein POM88_021978 [Heracleum sosnowskyi]
MHIRVDSNVSDDASDAYSYDFQLWPGPRDPSGLHLQAEHRSTHVWNAGGGDNQRSRVRCKFPALHRRMVPILRKLRSDGVARLADGNVVTSFTCAESAEGGWRDLIKQMFGSTPNIKSRALHGGRLKLSWLDGVVLEVLPDDADENELVRYTQAYLLQLLGGVLFTDHQGSQSCKIGVEEIAGCVLLVQLWAWTRLPTLAPVPSPPPLDIWGDLAGPYGLRWSGPKSFADVSSHVHVLAVDNVGVRVTDRYDIWYGDITRPYHTHIGAA